MTKVKMNETAKSEPQTVEANSNINNNDNRDTQKMEPKCLTSGSVGEEVICWL